MYLVTGGAGFIGSNIVADLDTHAPGQVAICDRLRQENKWRNIAKYAVADIVDPDALDDWLQTHAPRLTAVIHMGAISATTEQDVDKIVQTNLRLSQTLWHTCATHRIPFIYASSAATYGDGTQGFADTNTLECFNRFRPLNPYGWSKLLFDKWVLHRIASTPLAPPQWAGLRFFNVYGPNEGHKGRMKSVVCHAFPHAHTGTPVRLFRSHHPDYEDGGQLRDFVYVKDCVAVVLWLLQNRHVSGVFNLGTGQARSFKDLILALFTATGQTPHFDWVDTPEDIRDKYQYFTQADMTRLRDAGYTAPFWSVEDGVHDYVTTYLMNEADPYL